MSDEDMFLSSQQDIRPSTEVPSFISKSQPQKSDVEYHWVVLFHWSLENNQPFSVHLKSLFSDKEISDTWFSFKLRDDLRRKKIYMRMLNGKYSVFCKVEKGKNFPTVCL